MVRDLICAFFIVMVALCLLFVSLAKDTTLTDQEVALKIQACVNESGQYQFVLDKNNDKVQFVTCTVPDGKNKHE